MAHDKRAICNSWTAQCIAAKDTRAVPVAASSRAGEPVVRAVSEPHQFDAKPFDLCVSWRQDLIMACKMHDATCKMPAEWRKMSFRVARSCTLTSE
jgi:hypothetical protein